MFRVLPRAPVEARGLFGAIAQLGERLHGMQEVGGSIPPGSTTLRPSGYAWRSHARPKGKACRAEAHRAKAGLGTDCFSVIASEAKQSILLAAHHNGLLRFARNDG